MSQSKQFLAGILVGVGVVGVVLTVYFFVWGSSKAVSGDAQSDTNSDEYSGATEEVTVAGVDERDHIIGPKSAEVIIYEYADLECPYCKASHLVLEQIIDTYGGRVSWVYRHFPVELHENARIESEAAECAAELGGESMFWQYIRGIYALTSSNGTGFPVERLVPLAGELGLDEDVFETCLSSNTHAAKVNNDLKTGKAAGVTATPTFFVVNNAEEQISIQGEVTYEDMFAVVEILRQ